MVTVLLYVLEWLSYFIKYYLYELENQYIAETFISFSIVMFPPYTVMWNDMTSLYQSTQGNYDFTHLWLRRQTINVIKSMALLRDDL